MEACDDCRLLSQYKRRQSHRKAVELMASSRNHPSVMRKSTISSRLSLPQLVLRHDPQSSSSSSDTDDEKPFNQYDKRQEPADEGVGRRRFLRPKQEVVYTCPTSKSEDELEEEAATTASESDSTEDEKEEQDTGFIDAADMEESADQDLNACPADKSLEEQLVDKVLMFCYDNADLILQYLKPVKREPEP